jgi:hypothetical protein
MSGGHSSLGGPEDEWRLLMTAVAAPPDTGRVDDQQASDRGRTRVLTLEIETDSDPIAGRLSEGGAPERRFVGWLALARALELALEPAEREPRVNPPRARRGDRGAS